MPKYQCQISVETVGYVTIEAESQEEAEAKMWDHNFSDSEFEPDEFVRLQDVRDVTDIIEVD